MRGIDPRWAVVAWLVLFSAGVIWTVRSLDRAEMVIRCQSPERIIVQVFWEDPEGGFQRQQAPGVLVQAGGEREARFALPEYPVKGVRLDLSNRPVNDFRFLSCEVRSALGRVIWSRAPRDLVRDPRWRNQPDGSSRADIPEQDYNFKIGNKHWDGAALQRQIGLDRTVWWLGVVVVLSLAGGWMAWVGMAHFVNAPWGRVAILAGLGLFLVLAGLRWPLRGMLFLLGLQTLALTVFWAYGWWLARELQWRIPGNGPFRVAVCVCLGAFLIAGIGLAWHLAAPLDAVFGWTIGLGGLALVIWAGGRLKLHLPPTDAKFIEIRDWLWLALFVGGALLTANASLDAPRRWDSGLYHLNAIRWFTDYPVIAGQAHLHTRFGFNNWTFATHAWAESFFGRGLSPHLINGALWLPMLLALTGMAVRAGQAFARLILPIGVVWAGADLSSATPDFISLTGSLLLGLALVQAGQDGFQSWWDTFLLVVLLAAYLVMNKLSGLFLAGAAGLWWLGYGWRTGAWNWKLGPFLRVTAVLAVLSAVWLIHGILTSGYVVYPVAATQLPVDWALSVEKAQEEMHWAKIWARSPNHEAEAAAYGWSWLGTWFQRNWLDGTFRWPLVGLSVFLLVALARKEGRRALVRGPFIVFAIAILCWFLTAPDIRFLNGALWMAFAAVFMAAIANWRPGPTYSSAIVVAGLLWMATAYPVYWYSGHPEHKLGLGQKPVAELRVAGELDGETVWGLVPSDTSGLLWDSPLPATPREMPPLQGSLASRKLRAVPASASQ